VCCGTAPAALYRDDTPLVDASRDMMTIEEDKIRGAIRTDFVPYMAAIK
jgi:hypothetical protein